MGLFDGLSQPGPGVYADDQKEGAYIRFFRVFAQRFFTIGFANLLLLLTNLPALLLAYVFAIFVLPMLSPVLVYDRFIEYIIEFAGETEETIGTLITGGDQLYTMIILLLAVFLVGFSLFAVGPFQTALAYVFRNYVRGVPAFFWQDYKKSLRQNWKQSLIVSVISCIVSAIIFLNLGFYSTVMHGTFASIMTAVFIVILILFMCVQLHIYPMIASLELKTARLFLNAFIFTLIRLPSTLVILAIEILIFVLIPFVLIFLGSSVGFSIAAVFFVLFGFSLLQFINAFYVWEQIERFIATKEAASESSDEVSDVATMDKELEESTAEKAFEEMSNNPAADSDPENIDKNAGDSEDIEK
ncbi:MAG: DUF624 domain-containing protein [Clostridiaceae bacterium]|nr:DUF624 domain-containing protein [Clostridiaceae bacterium]